jgi:hypothetical protein
MALRVGLEPTTNRLTAGGSTIELPQINVFFEKSNALYFKKFRYSIKSSSKVPLMYSGGEIYVSQIALCNAKISLIL